MFLEDRPSGVGTYTHQPFTHCVKLQIVAFLQVGAAARQETEQWGWRAATHKIREQQYLRAIRRNRTKHRFGFLALRIGLGLLVRRWSASVWSVLLWALLQLDYARNLRGSSCASAAPALAQE